VTKKKGKRLMTRAKQPVLHNIRILDFTWVLAGPYGTRLLADFGAEVIKVQPLLSSETDDEFSRGYYNTWNRNKLGITLNLNKQEGIETAKKLVSVCDVVVENFTSRVMVNWGLDYENLKKLKPDIIMVSLSLIGQTGPRKDYTGYGPTVHAFSGLTYLTSFPGQPPMGPGFAYADHIAGLYASLAVLGALERRRRTGEGQRIDLSEVAVMKSLLDSLAPEPGGNLSTTATPHGVYPCKGKDHWCAIAVYNNAEWQELRQAFGNPDWAREKKFATLSGRLKNRYELDNYISAWTKRHTAADVMDKLQANGVVAGIVQDAADLIKDPQLKARGFFIDRPEIGKLVDASPIRLSASPAGYSRSAPTQGRDNDHVYGKLLGMNKKKIAALKKKGVI
jgi:crotonobetainyl-CoA:carnitine CoA-transferase CaiB-like acyl-CoA transferase